ncbi:MAG: hypothetical protein RIS61_698, partial [Actinomycetota bacterium]
MQFDGLIVPVITQFDENGLVDTKGVAAFTEILIEQGVNG